ncbi:MAG: hypothetical protein KDA44_23435, partial [Planctomycetales bacterium]|nr:hypothetical protein [Planctomycetales bacterium]
MSRHSPGNLLSWLAATRSRAAAARAPGKRSLPQGFHVERLEDRCLMDAAGLASAATDVLILQNPTSLVSDARYIDYAGPWAPALPAQTDRPVYNAI